MKIAFMRIFSISIALVLTFAFASAGLAEAAPKYLTALGEDIAAIKSAAASLSGEAKTTVDDAIAKAEAAYAVMKDGMSAEDVVVTDELKAAHDAFEASVSLIAAEAEKLDDEAKKALGRAIISTRLDFAVAKMRLQFDAIELTDETKAAIADAYASIEDSVAAIKDATADLGADAGAAIQAAVAQLENEIGNLKEHITLPKIEISDELRASADNTATAIKDLFGAMKSDASKWSDDAASAFHSSLSSIEAHMSDIFSSVTD